VQPNNNDISKTHQKTQTPNRKKKNQSLELAAGMDRLLAAAEVIPVCY
jgi:hypothetical protein